MHGVYELHNYVSGHSHYDLSSGKMLTEKEKTVKKREMKKRKKLFVYPSIQLNYISLLAGSGLILSLFYSIFFLYIYSQATSSLLLLVEGNQLLEQYLLTTEKLLFIGCILIIIFSGLLLATLALLHSHKVAGPLYRLEKVLEEMKEGKSPGKITLRKGDRVERLAALLEEVGKVMETNQKKEKILQESLKELSSIKLPPEIREKINSLQAKISE